MLDALEEYDLPRPLIVDLVRRELAMHRESKYQDSKRFRRSFPPLRTGIADLRATRIQTRYQRNRYHHSHELRPRPLSPETIRALTETGGGYANLEYDLVTGERGPRGLYIENALAVLCGAEAATVVNNLRQLWS